MESLNKQEPVIADAIKQELRRQRGNIELIASLYIVSRAVIETGGSVSSNPEGYPGKRLYGGCEYVDTVEEPAGRRIKEPFGADHAYAQPHRGLQSNMAVHYAPVKLGGAILGMKRAETGGNQ